MHETFHISSIEGMRRRHLLRTVGVDMGAAKVNSATGAVLTEKL